MTFGHCGIAPLEFRRIAGEVFDEVAPFEHPVEMIEVLFAELPEQAVAGAFGGGRVPEIQDRQEIRLRVAESPVRFVGRLLLFERPLLRVLNRQISRDDQELGQHAPRFRERQHPAEVRVDRQRGEFPPLPRQVSGRVEGAQVLERPQPLAHGRPGEAG